MIRVENLAKSYNGQVLFENVGFTINPKERVGLVGRNGHGKTTLLRILLGEEHPDEGSVAIPRHYTMGHVSQHLSFGSGSVLDEACAGLPEERRGERWQAEKILSGLGFAKADMEKPPLELSGGYQVRLNLTKALLAEPNLLLLDEPTNYLDITSIRWLTRFLILWKGELMIVTHDRGFMDNIITHTMGIHRTRVRKIAGTTENYYEQIAREEEIHEKTRINDERKRKDVELFISRFRAKARLANMVQSRIKTLEKQEKLARLEQVKTLEFSFNEAPFTGRYVMGADSITFSYTGHAPYLIEDFSISIGRDDRICIIGRNGRGKSTLLRILSGELEPLRGAVTQNAGVKMAYYAQTNVPSLRRHFTVEEEVLSARTDADRQAARNICGAMLFEGDNALKRIEVLSGGEKSRVLLGRMIATPANMLLLDEPTNHLDMESCDALLAAIDNFDGAVVIVTHNEMFLHALATRIVAFQGGSVMVHEGSYARFLEKTGWEEEIAEKDGGAAPEKADARPVIGKKELRRLRTEILTRRSKELKPLETRIADIEKRIVETDRALMEYNEQMIDASHSGDGARITSLSRSIHEARKSVDALYEELDGLTTDYESRSVVFDEELKNLSADNDE